MGFPLTRRIGRVGFVLPHTNATGIRVPPDPATFAQYCLRESWLRILLVGGIPPHPSSRLGLNGLEAGLLLRSQGISKRKAVCVLKYPSNPTAASQRRKHVGPLARRDFGIGGEGGIRTHEALLEA